jgi:hypothetical protein
MPECGTAWESIEGAAWVPHARDFVAKILLILNATPAGRTSDVLRV